MNQLSTKTSKRHGIRLNGRADDTVRPRRSVGFIGGSEVRSTTSTDDRALVGDIEHRIDPPNSQAEGDQAGQLHDLRVSELCA